MKKLACLVLSAAMIVGSALGFSACDLGGANSDLGGSGNNGSNNGGGSGDNGSGNNNGGGNGGSGVSVSVEELCTALSDYEIKAVEFEYEAKDINRYTNEEFVAATGKGTAAFTDSGVDLDMYQNMLSIGYSMENYEVTGYREMPEIDLYFLRGSRLYFGDVPCDDTVKWGEYEKAFETFKKEDGNGFQIGEAPSFISAIGDLYVIGMNAFSLLGGEAKAVENGYELSFTTEKAVAALGAKLSAILDAVKPEDKVASLLQNMDVVSLLEGLTRNMTAQELLSVIGGMLPEMPFPLPDAEDDEETPAEYIVRVARDEAFFASLELGMSEDVKSISDLSIDALAQMFSGKTGAELLAMAKDYIEAAMQENGLAKLLWNDENATCDVSIVFSFDANKKPIGMDGSMRILGDPDAGSNSSSQGGEGSPSQDEAARTAAVVPGSSNQVGLNMSGHFVFKDSVQFADLSDCYARTTYNDETEKWDTQKIVQ